MNFNNKKLDLDIIFQTTPVRKFVFPSVIYFLTSQVLIAVFKTILKLYIYAVPCFTDGNSHR